MAKYFLLLSLLLCHLAVAHQQKTANTTLLVNADTGYIEISHRLYVHDAEHYMKSAFQKNGFDLISDESARVELAAYVAKCFELELGGSMVNDLKLLGSEVDGKFFWVYHIMPIPSGLLEVGEIKFNIKDTILMDGIPSQTNLVHVEYLGQHKTAVFKKHDGWQSLTLHK